MLSWLKYIRENQEEFKTSEAKRFHPPDTLENLLKLDAERRGLIVQEQKYCKLQKVIQSNMRHANEEKEIETTINEHKLELNLEFLDKLTNGEIDPKQHATPELSKYLKLAIDDVVGANKELEKKILYLLPLIGNVLDDKVAVHESEERNEILIIKEFTQLEHDVKTPLYHHQIMDKINGVDFIGGSRIGGQREYLLFGDLVKLNTGLMHYAQDFLSSRGFTLVSTPFWMIREEMSQVCQLSEFEDTLYKLESNDKTGDRHDKFLIATSEQPLTAWFREKILRSKDLPMKLGGVSSCFRKEIGRNGVDTLGVFRVHRFEKVEQFCVTNPKDSPKMFLELRNNATEFYDSLGLGYRVVNIVSKELNLAASIKHDIEGYFPASKNYRELASCSNCTNFFTQKLHCVTSSKEYPHMLNATLCANTRTLCCILETWQTDDGVVVPSVLRPYVKMDFIKYVK